MSGRIGATRPKAAESAGASVSSLPMRRPRRPPVRSPGLGQPPVKEDPWDKFWRVGLLDNAFLVAPALAGFALEDTIAEAFPKARGYGPLLGAVIGNAISNGLAGATGESLRAGLGSFTGALLPLVPLVGAVVLNRPLNTTTKTVLGVISTGLAGWTIWQGRKKRRRLRAQAQSTNNTNSGS